MELPTTPVSSPDFNKSEKLSIMWTGVIHNFKQEHWVCKKKDSIYLLLTNFIIIEYKRVKMERTL